MDTTDYNDWSQSAMVELSVAKGLFRGYTPAPASPPRSSTSCEARLVLSEYLTFSLQGFLASRQTAHAAPWIEISQRGGTTSSSAPPRSTAVSTPFFAHTAH